MRAKGLMCVFKYAAVYAIHIKNRNICLDSIKFVINASGENCYLLAKLLFKKTLFNSKYNPYICGLIVAH
jgi:hypothetical protein